MKIQGQEEYILKEQWMRLLKDEIKIMSIFLKNLNAGYNVTIYIFQTFLESQSCFEEVRKFIHDQLNKSYDTHSKYLKQISDYKKCKGGNIEDFIGITSQMRLIFEEEAKVQDFSMRSLKKIMTQTN